MRILYIFPHPDDESFGPAPGIVQQLNQEHEVYLLTLTKGGATKVRHKLNLSVEEMGEIRYREMLDMETVLNLTGMTVLDLPDSGLKEMCPMDIEQVVEVHINQIQPDILVTYAVHGVSGFHDHLVTHAVVKRVFCKLKRKGDTNLKRLALFTLGPDYEGKNYFNLEKSTDEEIDCTLSIKEDESELGKKALDCYKTYSEVIEKTGVRDGTSNDICFEFFQESFSPRLTDITDGLS